jgi:aspartate/methionine/tyrosine aminotransferase
MDRNSSTEVQVQRQYVELQVGVPYANLMSSQSLFTHAFAQHYNVDPGYVLPTPGTTGAIEAVRNHVFYRSGKKNPACLTVTPGYWRARESLQGLGFEIIEIRTQPRGFLVDESEIVAKAIEQRPDLIYLSLPNNPTGAIFEPGEIIRSVPETTAIMIDLTLPSYELDVRVVLPKLYRNFAEREGLFLVGSTSKSHRTAEYRIGWAVCANGQDAQELRKENRNVLPIPSIKEGMRQLGKGPIVLENISQSFAFLKAGEGQGKFTIVKPARMAQTGYMLVEAKVGIGELKQILEERNIRIMWGSAIGLTDQFMRLETLEPANIQIFVDAINSCADVA